MTETTRRTIRAGLALVAAAVLSSAVVASAQDARTRFLRGQTAYQQGDYDAALREWNAAYAADPRPLIQLNLSQAYERLGRLQDAAAALDRYLETAAPEDENQADARARRASLRERLARTGVRITGAPDGATITIDGRAWGRTPRPDAIAVEPGSHRVEITLEGYARATVGVVVPAGQTVDVPIEMERSGAGSTDSPRTDGPGTTTTTDGPRGAGGETGTTTGGEGEDGDAAGASAGAGAGDEGGAADGGGGGPPIAPIVLLGVGGAAIVTGAILGVLALGKAGDAETSESPEADDAKLLALFSDLGTGVGLLAVGAGLALLLLGDDDDATDGETAPPPDSVATSFRPRLEVGRGLVLGGDFSLRF